VLRSFPESLRRAVNKLTAIETALRFGRAENGVRILVLTATTGWKFLFRPFPSTLASAEDFKLIPR
jgi:hypothetical protein